MPSHRKHIKHTSSTLPSTSGSREAKLMLRSIQRAEFLYNLEPRFQTRLDEYLADPSNFNNTYSGFTAELLALLRQKMDYADQVMLDLAAKTQQAKDELDQIDEDDRVFAGQPRPKNKQRAVDPPSTKEALEDLSKALDKLGKGPLGDSSNKDSVCSDPLCTAAHNNEAKANRNLKKPKKKARPARFDENMVE